MILIVLPFYEITLFSFDFVIYIITVDGDCGKEIRR